MNVLITGLQNMVKDSVVKIALERLGASAKFKILSFSDFVGEDEGSITELRLLKTVQQRLTKKVQVSMLQSKTGEHNIINGYSTASTKLGYMPIITKAGIDIFNPDLIAFIEVDPLALGEDLKDKEGFEAHQAVEKSFAMLYGAWTGAAVKVIKAGPEGSRKGSGELFNLLKALLVVK